MDTYNAPDVKQLTCQACDYTVSQSSGAKRTICPQCGNFYNSGHAENPPEPRRKLRNHKADNRLLSKTHPAPSNSNLANGEKSGRFEGISNFFNKINPNRRAKSTTDSSLNELDQNVPSNKVSPRSKGRPASQPANSLLPPIAAESKGRLTVDVTPSSTPQPPRSANHAQAGNRHRILSESNANNRLKESPAKNKSIEQLRNDVQVSRETGQWAEVQDFFATIFESFVEINLAFKRDPYKEYKSAEDNGLKMDYVYGIYEILVELPQDVQKIVLKAVISSLLKDKRVHTKDDLRAYLVLIQNPQFKNTSTYVIFAHLLRQMAALSDNDHHYLVHWFKKLQVPHLRSLVLKLHCFISVRLFPPKPQDLPPMPKCTWWVPSATKVLALLNAANNMSHPTPLSFLDFYSATLDHIDLMAEYYTWQNQSAHPGFSFCQYPFILSIAAKRSILQRDSEQQMIIMARRSLVAKVQRRQMPDIGMLFLNLNVRRTHLVSDSLNEVASKQHDLKKKLKVTFTGEPGLDMGGLTKEWFLLLIRQIFQHEYGMFTYHKKARMFWFSTDSCEDYQEFNLVGVLMGLAIYNSINLDIQFPPCVYKKLLSPAVVPYNNPNASVGVGSFTISDLTHAMPEIAHSLKELLSYDGDVEDDFCLTFEVSYGDGSNMKTYPLKQNAGDIPVTKDNRQEYVQLYVDFLLNKSIYSKFKAFYHGFHSVCASNALIMLRAEEVEMLVCGSPNIDMAQLKRVTTYDGYHSSDPTVKGFWEVVFNMPQTFHKRLLLFCTGSDRIPIGGMAEMQFKITKVENVEMLPVAHTCFNQLVLPAYTSRKMLRQKLIIAVENAEGFGLE